MALSQRLIARDGLPSLVRQEAGGTATQLTRTAAQLTRTTTQLTRTAGGGGRSSKLVSCPNIAVKCDVVEYL